MAPLLVYVLDDKGRRLSPPVAPSIVCAEVTAIVICLPLAKVLLFLMINDLPVQTAASGNVTVKAFVVQLMIVSVAATIG